jgi:ribosomal protein L34
MKIKTRKSSIKKKRKSGYRARARTQKGRKIMKRRRRRGRKPTSV